ncbi:MAG: VWA domain-containing protein [Desulfobacula sp.]|uniref:VWA domain-containing protein n=1 Tax=Desulfobacula sp. TaxID=2593537 RepID=UPI0025C550AC|nr:VWA domain-containing protein [Desulfobacula sp.]MCD4718827.1 VWA domain-containing protein [Desulfobacula sp.]
MQSGIPFHSLKTGLLFFFILFLGWYSAHATEFTADLLVTSPESEIVYDLKVKDNMYRVQKVKGLEYMPPFPTIYNRATGISWGLNPQVKQYVEQTDPAKTMMMNPIAGWEFMRKNLEVTPTGKETIQGYSCQVFEFRQKGDTRVSNRVWVSSELGFELKEISYALNGNTILALKNIKKSSIDPAFFKIPSGYSKIIVEKSSKKNNKKKNDKAAGSGQPMQASNEDKSKVVSSPQESTAPANLMFILDASGSMWGQVEGTAKIAIAKEVLTDLIKGLPDDIVAGLVAYGHRRKGDCNDVEELIALGPLNKQAMIARVQDLSPKGKTPISRSVRLTAERIKHLEDETTIILVSDGKETCDPDPCGLVKDLKASGIKFIMHVIGFDVTEEEKKQLECMAKEGGGKYFTADNAGEFSAAASEVVKKSIPTYGTLRIKVSKNGKPFFTAITLTNMETGKSWAPGGPYDKAAGIAERQLAPGNYTAELKDLTVSGGKTPIVKLTDIVIKAGETVERIADFSDGTLMITTLLNGAPFKAYIFYYRQGENKHFHNEHSNPKTGQLKRKLLPGIYRIKAQTDRIVGTPTVVFDALEIAPGSTVEKTVELFSGEVIIASTLNGKPKEMPFKVYDTSGKQIYKNWSSGGQRLIRLAAGTYTIKVTTNVDGSIKSFENIIVETGQSQTVQADFSFGKLTIAATLNGQPFSTPFKGYDSAGKQVLKNWTQNGQRTEMLAEGIYTVKITSIKDNKQVVTFENINIVNLQHQTVTADFPVAAQ